MKGKIPERMCVACRQMHPKNQLVRLVLADGEVAIDLTGKKNGRGVYLCKNAECLAKARKNKGFSKTYGFSLSDELCTQLEKLFEQ